MIQQYKRDWVKMASMEESLLTKINSQNLTIAKLSPILLGEYQWSGQTKVKGMLCKTNTAFIKREHHSNIQTLWWRCSSDGLGLL